MIEYLAIMLLVAWGGWVFYQQVHQLNALPATADYPARLAHSAALALALGTVLFAIGDRPVDAFCLQIVAAILHRILTHADSHSTRGHPGPL